MDVESCSLAGKSSHLGLPDGMTLAADQWRPGRRSPSVVVAHGFGQTRQAWTSTARALAENDYDVTIFDARGHGESDRAPDGVYHLDDFVDDMLSVARAAISSDGHPPVLVGASMGGLLALVAAGEAGAHPPFSALVLVDITPRWEATGVERILGFMRAHPDGFTTYDDAASAIAAYLPHRRERKTEDQLRPLLRRHDDGRLRWHWDPALLNIVVNQVERYQPRLHAAARRIDVPVLLLSGSHSDVVSKATADEFLQCVPHARHVVVPNATHMVAGDANDTFTHEIVRFLQDLPSDPVFDRHADSTVTR